MKLLKRRWESTNGGYLAACVICSVISVAALVSLGMFQLGGWALSEEGAILGPGGYNKAITQAVAACSGLCFALILGRVNYRHLLRHWKIHTALLWGLVAPTLFLHNVRVGPLTIGYDVGGTGNFSWYRLGSLSIQPSELAKISFILTYSKHLDAVKERLNRPFTLLLLLIHMALPVAAIHIQGDDGSALIFALMGCAMLFCAGLSWKYIAAVTAAGAAAVSAVVGLYGPRILKSYQLGRIMALLDPENPEFAAFTYQQNKGVMSIGSGQLSGNGLFAQNHNYIPYAWNDFIFDYMGEAFGFVGMVAVLSLLFYLMLRTLRTARRSEDMAGSLICMGMFGALFFQTLLNVGMNLQVLPVIGVTLPFFSAGGTSVWMMYLGAGLVVSVHRFNRDTVFEKSDVR